MLKLSAYIGRCRNAESGVWIGKQEPIAHTCSQVEHLKGTATVKRSSEKRHQCAYIVGSWDAIDEHETATGRVIAQLECSLSKGCANEVLLEKSVFSKISRSGQILRSHVEACG